MKIQVVNFFTRLIVLVLFPQIVFGALFTPLINNEGPYKQYSLSDQQNLRPLFGHVPADVKNARQIGPVDESLLLSLSIVLPLNHEEELDNRLVDITNPISPRYQQYL